MKSAIALSIHKAGSTISDSILRDFFSERGYEVDDIAEKSWKSAQEPGEFFVAYQDKMRAEGVYYGMARGAYVKKMERLFGLRLVVQVRDPRDCLTSNYFSLSRSHALPPDSLRRRRFRRRREEVAAMTLDEFCLREAPKYRHRLLVLHEIVARHDDHLLLKYEEMVDDTETWLDKISYFVGQPLSPPLRAKLIGKCDFKIPDENSDRIKRQVRPGDHNRKLAKQTVSAVSEILGDVLEHFDYAR